MPGEIPPPVQNQPGDVGGQRIELKNLLQLNIHIAYESSASIKAQTLFGNTINPSKVKEFYQAFWYIYYYVKNSVDEEKLDANLVEYVESWFDMIPGQARDAKLILMGIDIFLDFAKEMRKWGIGQLFEQGIEPPFSIEGDPDLIRRD